MHAATIDTGSAVAYLRAFGPPDVLPLEPIAGNGSLAIGADGFWTVVRAVSFELVAAAGGAARTPRLSWLADDVVPFAQALAPFTIAATITSRVTFAVDVQQAGANNAASIIAPMPALTLLPGWTLKLDVVNGAAGDAVKNGRVYLQRYRLVDLVDRPMQLVDEPAA
jgi:hypothetical protein